MHRLFFLTILGYLLLPTQLLAEVGGIILSAEGNPLEFVKVTDKAAGKAVLSGADGTFIINEVEGERMLHLSLLGYRSLDTIVAGKHNTIHLESLSQDISETVITGTLTEVSQSASPIAIQSYNASFFKHNPEANLLESIGQIGGVRPQLNCNICGTGDIHINGMEGGYTMILLDGMPIVSGLASVYGFSSLPMSMISRIEVVKGPASTLYGSEAIGGVINIITKKPGDKQTFSADAFTTSQLEQNLDLGYSWKQGNRWQSLASANLFFNLLQVDNNNDNYTDLPLSKRLSVMNSWSLESQSGARIFSITGRGYAEDRWGGQLNGIKSDTSYTEKIDTRRGEFLLQYSPANSPFQLMSSIVHHAQNSSYGRTIYIADQTTVFNQLLARRQKGKHSLISGAAYRYTLYDDNTPATSVSQPGTAGATHLPGAFVEDTYSPTAKLSLLGGLRGDYHTLHGLIWTPRLALKYAPSTATTFRLNAGSGFRVINIFTEEHAALTGARTVIAESDLAPEKSWNINTTLNHGISIGEKWLSLELGGWYANFTSSIYADYSDPRLIKYSNDAGNKRSYGASLTVRPLLGSRVSADASFNWINVMIQEKDEAGHSLPLRRLELSEPYNAAWTFAYRSLNRWSLAYTGNVVGSMLMPLAGEQDPRPDRSPIYSLHNFKVGYSCNTRCEIYGGVKNVLNFIPQQPIIRGYDPFDKDVELDGAGNVLVTPLNPYGLTFDAAYAYAPLQGRRYYLGFSLGL